MTECVVSASKNFQRVDIIDTVFIAKIYKEMLNLIISTKFYSNNRVFPNKLSIESSRTKAWLNYAKSVENK